MSRAVIPGLLALLLITFAAEATQAPPNGRPEAVIDLMTSAGVQRFDAKWRYSDVEIVPVSFRRAGADGQPTGIPATTYDYQPRAGWIDYDDSNWPIIEPESLAQRRGAGRVSFNWYRIALTVPERVGRFDTRGSTAMLTVSVDDYAEIWVDGELTRHAAQIGGSVVAGWNAPNRLVIGRDLQPGQRIQLAVFGINGPISASPTNFIYVREARIELYPGTGGEPRALEPHEVNIDVVRLDPAIDRLVPPNPKLFKLADGFRFTEGPVWSPDGALLFSDPNANRIYRYHDGVLSVSRELSGYSGADIARYRQPGSNGLDFDPQGRLTIAEHGNRRITRLEADGRVTVLADRYDGKRLNSPNDLVYRSNGVLYFTDPPFGLPGFFDDPEKELPFSGIFAVIDGRVELLASELRGPNGLAFSPDERFLYVDNWDNKAKVVMRYPVFDDGRLGPGELLFDMTGAPGEEALDGLKVDREGNLYVSGPGGLWILSAQGHHLGTLRTPRLAANFAWGDDGRTLYLTARTALYRIQLTVNGG